MSDDEHDERGGGTTAVVLDFLAHGRAEDDRPQYEKEPLAYVIDSETFALFELTLEPGTDVSIADTVDLDELDDVLRTARVDHDDLPRGASSELEYVVEEIVTANERRFVDFYNEAGPITLRLHQLNLLPGIGEKLRNNVLDERKRKPFESFEEVEQRIDGLHDPRGVLIERILEEIREEELKYRLFARDEQ